MKTSITGEAKQMKLHPKKINHKGGLSTNKLWKPLYISWEKDGNRHSPRKEHSCPPHATLLHHNTSTHKNKFYNTSIDLNILCCREWNWGLPRTLSIQALSPISSSDWPKFPSTFLCKWHTPSPQLFQHPSETHSVILKKEAVHSPKTLE